MNEGPYRGGMQSGICPRCGGAIESDGEMGRLVCAVGCGEWYPREAIETIVQWERVKLAPADLAAGWPWGGAPCPICRQDMKIRSAQQMRFDLCPTDGLWLDTGEYEEFIEAYGRPRR
jgi:Zn-finger nucleic acid-binding protein